MRVRNVWLLVLTGFLHVSLVVFCWGNNDAASTSPPHSAEGIPDQVYTAVVLRDFPPLYQTDAENNPTGYAIDVLKQVADRAGFDVTYLIVDNWAEAADAVKTGRGDLVPAYGVTSETGEDFVYSTVVETIPVSVFVRHGTTAIQGANTLAGQKTAVLHGGSAERELTARAGIDLVSAYNAETAVMQLLSGEVDAFVFPYPVMMQLLRRSRITDKIKAAGAPLYELSRSFLLRPEDTRLLGRINAALEDYSGSEQQLADYARWYGEDPPFWTAERVFQGMAGLMLGGLALFLVLHYVVMGRTNRRLRETVHELNMAHDEIAVWNQELEKRVQDRTRQLSVANEELASFSYSVSHDLRAPLRGIDGWSQALLEDYGNSLDEEAKTYLDRVRSETQRMGYLIDDLLNLSRTTRMEMQTSTVSLSELAWRVVERLREAEPDRDVQVEIQTQMSVVSDARLLEVVLTNLIGNAWKFTAGRSPGKIELGWSDQREQENLVYYVKDNGVGFDMNYAQHLFGVFQRMHKPSEFPGTGVGLAMVKRILHRLNGRIWAEAAPDQGAVFYFTVEEAS